MKFSRQNVLIKTDIKDENLIRDKFTEVLDFANKLDFVFNAGTNPNGELVYDVEVEGNTSAYCKGIVEEVKFLVKKAFNCKLEVLFYAY